MKLMGGEVRKAQQIHQYFSQLLLINRLNISILAHLERKQGRLPPLPKSLFAVSIAAFAYT
ncbi:MAG: hypothetical protein EA343_07605 [Nodularia sp. (in: Bacteria)]|nr:MAG: hypothetical protein EA343_07605 [Nodularia sp. (in: cyanobacteria)]